MNLRGKPGPPAEEPSVEVWAGVECTINRVGDRYFEQLERSGHAKRAGDLDALAALGVRAVRYPVLWERTAPGALEEADWRFADERLGRLRALGVRPIVGLVHHGSGPRHTSLVDPAFPEKLAAYALAVAERYPWVHDWTPVNEPLTTARFSGLYGHWYPHGRDVRTFARALVQQCRGIALAMRAIRRVVPGARLVQTDDMGHTSSTPRLSYQASFDNERRYLGFDLLTGRVGKGHAFWDHLLAWGVEERELEFFLEHPCPPDVVGLNYYVTSDRHLDERQELYPAWSHGGNGRDAYADVHATRVHGVDLLGHAEVLRRAHARYGLPVALTEVHIGGARDDQLRWVVEAWNACLEVAREGRPVRAMTAWSLFGAFDWNGLVCCDNGFYEPGVFDVRGGAPRPTALAALLRALARGGEYEHPVLARPGWWRRPERMVWGAPEEPREEAEALGDAEERRVSWVGPEGEPPRRQKAPPILITGATGTLGRALARVCAARALPFRLVGRAEMDIADLASVEAALDRHAPWAVVNTAGFVRVDDAEREHARCLRENTVGPAVLALACRERGLRLATFSSDLVFDGAARSPYLEGAPVAPLNVYGRSKAEAERRVLRAMPEALILRTSAFFGPWDAHNFVVAVLRATLGGRAFVAAEDAVVSPTYVPDLAHATLDLLIDGEGGVWHLANRGELSWRELAARAAILAGADPKLVVGRPTRALGLAAARPVYSALGSERGCLLPRLEDALARFLDEREPGLLEPGLPEQARPAAA